MSCTFCDAPLPAGARYCPQCGASVGPGQVFEDEGPEVPIGKPAPLFTGDDELTPFAPRPTVTTSTTAVISLACGIAAWSLLPFIGAVLAVITGHQARREIAQSRGMLEGDGLATVGLVLGYIQLIPVILVLAIGLFVIALGFIGAAIDGGML